VAATTCRGAPALIGGSGRSGCLSWARPGLRRSILPTVDYPCDGEAVLRDESANGDYIGVAMTAEGQPALAGYRSPFGGNVFSMSGRFGSGFAIVGADGFTEEGIAGGYEPLTPAPRTTTGSRSSPRPRVT
jgi:hypothetical protein